eukprot:TRINITY_DN2343_c0_g2_i1.p1 TRINITY_DN2343_c0_g2~~TRINITY_DN2343_c0_g2_i1.p1  ORF type:complete len:730 (+),score=293.68 TRINITY_DN2343_c0_g2_i1:226-2415(+)
MSRRQDGEDNLAGDVIIPPKEIRETVDATAQYMMQAPKGFENILREKEAKNQQFQFLFEESPYHAYYRQKLESIRNENQEKNAPQPPPSTEEKKGSSSMSAGTTSHRVVEREAIRLEAPPPDEFIIRPPKNIPCIVWEVMKTSAEFVAKRGREFIQVIASRERHDPLFDFVKKTHFYHATFLRMVESFEKIVQMPKDMITMLHHNAEDQLGVLRRLQCRAEWEARRRKEEEENEAETDENGDGAEDGKYLIDWHSFVVVETIDFFDDELLDQLDLGKDEGEEGGSTRKANGDAQREQDMEEEEKEDHGEEDMEVDEIAPPPSKFQKGIVRVLGASAPPTSGVKPAPPPRPPQPPPAPAMASSGGKKAIDPITGELISLDQASEHLRIQLLDPQWKEQKEREREKFRTTNIAGGDEMVHTLSDFRKKRPDIFGDEEEEKRIMEELNRKKSDAPMLWDGFTASKQAVALETMRRLKEGDAGSEGAPSAPVVGPSYTPMMGPGKLGVGGPGAAPLAPMPPIQTIHGYVPPPVAPELAATPGYQPQPAYSLPSRVAAPASTASGSGSGVGGQPGGGMSSLPAIQDVDMDVTMEDEEPVAEKRDGHPMSSEEAKLEPLRKKQKGELESAAEWMSSHPNPIVLRVRCGIEEDRWKGWNIPGEVLEIPNVPLDASFGDLKKKYIFSHLEGAMPVSKMKLGLPDGTFVKDGQTLAFYNFDEEKEVVLVVKERGGRRR